MMYVARNHFHSRAPAIEGALETAIANVRSDSAREDWVLCGFKGGDDIQLIGTGVGGIEVGTQGVPARLLELRASRRAHAYVSGIALIKHRRRKEADLLF